MNSTCERIAHADRISTPLSNDNILQPSRHVLFVRHLVIFALCLFQSVSSFGQVAIHLLKDINTYQENPNPEYIAFPDPTSPIATVGNMTFFFATSAASGQELWKTTGTPQTASLVKDISPGPASTAIGDLTATDNRVYFIANNYQLWTSDGTDAGTFLLKDFINKTPHHLIAVNSTLYFLGITASAGQELWKTDGTPAGTVMVKDINPGSGTGAAHYMVKVNSSLYFTAIQSGSTELWKTDGTSGGTVKIVDTNNTSISSPYEIVNANGVVYCNTNFGLYRTDGTQAGTFKIDIPVFDAYAKNNTLTAVGDGAYFMAASNQPAFSNQLWYVAPGQSIATLMKDLYPSGTNPEPNNFTAFRGQLYFTSWDAQNGYELWRSGATPASTTIVKDIVPGLSNGIRPLGDKMYMPPLLTVAGNYLYFISYQGERLLTRTDGTAAGTVVVSDIGVDVAFRGMTAGIGETLYFIANDYITGDALWKTDGASTTMIKDIVETLAMTFMPGNGETGGRIFYKGFQYFGAHDGAHGKELWRTDGTTGNTTLLKDISPGTWSSSPRSMIVWKNELYFIASDVSHNEEIWKTDGTAAGTVRITDVSLNGEFDTQVLWLDAIENKLLFVFGTIYTSELRQLWSSEGTTASSIPITPIGDWVSYYGRNIKSGGVLLLNIKNPISGHELWRTDGTVAGTLLLKDINPGTGDSEARYFFAINDITYFAAYEPSTGYELYRTDGTPAGTNLVKDICPGSCSSLYPSLGFSAINNKLYFTGYTPGETYSVFQSDGTDAGTVRLHNPIPGYNGYGAPVGYNQVNGKIIYIFANKTPTAGNALWSIDETTFAAQTIRPMTTVSGYADGIQTYNNLFYFIHNDNISGSEIWKSDGTTTGTTILRDINKGVGSSSAEKFKAINNALYFTATDGVGQFQLWKSDGICGTRKILTAVNAIRDYFVLGNRMVLLINDPQYGEEYFYYELNEEPALTCAAAQTISFVDPGTKSAGDPSFDVNISATSGLPVTLISSDPTIATVSGSRVTILKAGQVTVTAYQEGNDDFLAATPVARTLTIQKLSQSISFPELTGRRKDAAPFLVTATASSSLPVTLTSSNVAVATVSGLQITVHAAGQTTITASQIGNANYLPASSVSRTLMVEAVPLQTQTVTLQEFGVKYENSVPFLANATSSSGLPLVLTTSNPTVAVVNGLQVKILTVGQTVITATQGGNATFLPASVSRTLIVMKTPLLEQVITFSELGHRPEASDPFFANASSSSGLPISLTTSDVSIASVSGIEISVHQAGEVTITATQPGNATYLPAAPVSRLLIVDPVLGIEDPSFSIHAYPNPTSGIIVIDTRQTLEAIRLTDVFGRSVAFKSGTDKVIDISEQPVGLYFITVVFKSAETLVLKISKQ